jgi:alpha-amylase
MFVLIRLVHILHAKFWGCLYKIDKVSDYSSQEYMSGVLNYPQYYWVTQAFESTSGSISNLVNGINEMKSDCSDTTLLGTFMENHDNPRFPSLTSDISLTKNAIAFTMLSDGIPISK